MPFEKYLTPKEVAAILVVSKMTVYRMIGSGELNAVQIGTQFRISDRSLRALLERSIVVPK